MYMYMNGHTYPIKVLKNGVKVRSHLCLQITLCLKVSQNLTVRIPKMKH